MSCLMRTFRKGNLKRIIECLNRENRGHIKADCWVSGGGKEEPGAGRGKVAETSVNVSSEAGGRRSRRLEWPSLNPTCWYSLLGKPAENIAVRIGDALHNASEQ